jgi:hypothetical protein
VVWTIADRDCRVHNLACLLAMVNHSSLLPGYCLVLPSLLCRNPETAWTGISGISESKKIMWRTNNSIDRGVVFSANASQ